MSTAAARRTPAQAEHTSTLNEKRWPVFDRERQLALLAKIAAGVDEASAEDGLKSADRKNLAIAAAVLVDKTRLIHGEATDRVEGLTPAQAEELKSKRERSVSEAQRLLRSVKAPAAGG